MRLVIATGDEKTYARHRAAGVSFLQSFYRQSTDAMGKAALFAGMRALESSALPGLRGSVGKEHDATEAEVDLGRSLRQPYDLPRCGATVTTEVVLLVGLHRLAMENEELREVVSPFWPPSDQDDSICGASGRLAGISDELEAAFNARVALWANQIEPDQAARAAGCAPDAVEHDQHHVAQRAKDLLLTAAQMVQWRDVAATAKALYAPSFQNQAPTDE